MLDETTRQRIMLQQEGAVLASVGSYNDARVTCEIARCQLDGIANALIRMQGAKETASFVFALSDRVSGGVRDVTDCWPPSSIGKVIEYEPPAAPPAPPSSRSERVSDFYYGFIPVRACRDDGRHLAGDGEGVMAPVRIQRKRVKGWKMPPNTVSVTRPGKWGNPFDFRSSDCCWLALSYGCKGDRLGRQEASVRAFREWIEPQPKGRKTVRYERGVSFGNDKASIQVGPRFIVGPPPSIKDIRAALAGKNLACFCALDQPCHADVLLELANKPHCEEAA